MNQNSILEEIKRRLRSVNSCYHLVQNLLSSTLPSKNIKVKIQRPIIVPVVLYGCETWLLKLREECRLRVSENRVLKRISGRKRDKVTEERRKLDNEELTDMNSSLRKVGWVGHVARMEERRDAYRVLVGKPEEETNWKT